jgi:hypothetical protein
VGFHSAPEAGEETLVTARALILITGTFWGGAASPTAVQCRSYVPALGTMDATELLAAWAGNAARPRASRNIVPHCPGHQSFDFQRLVDYSIGRWACNGECAGR